MNKINKTIGLLCKLQNILPRELLLTTYKSFVRLHLDYGDVIYDQHYSNSFHQKLQPIKYNATLAITGARRGSYREKSYQDFLINLISTTRTEYRTRNNISNIPRFNIKHKFFKSLFFPSTVIEWNNLDKRIRRSESLTLFNKSILQFIWPTPNRTFNCHNPIGIKLITRLRLGLSHLRDHKFKHNFLDCLNPTCCCGKDTETTVHYLLHCPIFSATFEASIKSGSDPRISETLLFGICSFNDTKNTSILNTTIDYTLSTKRFDVPLTNIWFVLKHLCIENMSFKFYNLIVNSFTKFLPYYIIGLGI